MTSVVVNGSEVFGSCYREIDASVELMCAGGAGFAVGWKYLKLMLAGEAAYAWQQSWGMVQGIGSRLWLIEGG
jgi:hypothetical protein